jgi:hypothetical protein
MRHRALRVELRRFFKGTDGSSVIKAMQPCEALVEIALGEN